MEKINSPEDLQKIKESYLASINGTGKTLIRVHMGTSGLASGAKTIYLFLKSELEKRNIDCEIISTGDMGYCFAEPTIEVTRPGEEPVVFGNVDNVKADRIIEKYIKNGELIDGIIPMNYQTI